MRCIKKRAALKQRDCLFPGGSLNTAGSALCVVPRFTSFMPFPNMASN